ncbi:MAG: hypothetical protein NDI90_15620 [Nitrospira sp. BO4]|jgi:hypothetical protein|nr:hypothetical protein [Nitrospira sp. BO4]
MNRGTLLAVVATAFLASNLMACVSGRTPHKFHPYGKEVTCFEPPKDVVEKGGGVDASIAIKEIGEVLKASGSAKVDTQRIREISTGVNDFEVLEFRFCTQYGNEVLTPQEYQKFQTEVLPILHSSKNK